MKECRGHREERGQSLIEYTLLLGFIALGAVAFLLPSGDSARGIWQSTSTQLTTANTTAQGTAQTGAAQPPPREWHDN